MALSKKTIEYIKAGEEISHKNYSKLYMAKVHHINTRGKRMNFERFPFLVEIYKSLQDFRVFTCMKSVQCGISEAFIVSHFDDADHGLAIQYVLPKQDIRNRFVHNRINRLKEAVPYYARRILEVKAGVDNVTLKRFGRGIINYVDSNSQSNFTEFPGDALYVDELDQCNQPNVAMAPDRLSSSEYRFERYVANPSVENYGIHVKFLEGTQGHWMTRCPKCKDWQPYDFFVNVLRQIGKRQYEIMDKAWEKNIDRDVFLYCRKCGRKLDRFAKGSEWIHTNNSEYASYQINKIFSPHNTIRELVMKFFKVLHDETKLQLFYNSDLGIPYTAAGSKITEKMLDETRVSGYVMPDTPDNGWTCYAGIDVGADLNIVIRRLIQERQGVQRPAVFIGTVKNESELISILKRYRVKIAVIDALPETRLVERVQAKLSSVYSCFFGNVKMPTVNRKDRVMTFRRTPLLDRTIEQYRAGEIKNPAGLRDIPDYYKQMQSNTRILDPDKMEFEWRQSVDPDHYHFAEAYACAASELAIGSDIFAYFEQIADGITARKEIDDGVPIEKVNEPNRKEYKNAQSFFDDLTKRR